MKRLNAGSKAVGGMLLVLVVLGGLATEATAASKPTRINLYGFSHDGSNGNYVKTSISINVVDGNGRRIANYPVDLVIQDETTGRIIAGARAYTSCDGRGHFEKFKLGGRNTDRSKKFILYYSGPGAAGKYSFRITF